MKNADMPAMPLGEACLSMANVNMAASGLTKREYIAIKMMQALASESGRYMTTTDMAHDAVFLAGYLLAELEKCAAHAATES